MICNFGAYLDRLVLTPTFMYTQTYDPEGIFSTLTSFTNTFVGILFCLTLKKHKSNKQKLLTEWSLIAMSLIIFAYFLSIWVPFNKKVWSFSFIFATCGYSALSQLVLYIIVDLWKNPIVNTILRPFVWLGSNPLFVYVLMMFICSLLNCNIVITYHGKPTSVYQWLSSVMLESWISNQ